MGIGTWVIVGIGAWIVLFLPVGLLVGAMAHSARRAPQRPGLRTTTRAAMAAAVHSPVALPAQTSVAATRLTGLAQV